MAGAQVGGVGSLVPRASGVWCLVCSVQGVCALPVLACCLVAGGWSWLLRSPKTEVEVPGAPFLQSEALAISPNQLAPNGVRWLALFLIRVPLC